MIVNVDEIERCLRYFKEINNADLDEIVWMRHGDQIVPDPALIKEFRFIGLSNRDFPSVAGWMPDDVGIRVSVMSFTKESVDNQP